MNALSPLTIRVPTLLVVALLLALWWSRRERYVRASAWNEPTVTRDSAEGFWESGW